MLTLTPVAPWLRKPYTAALDGACCKTISSPNANPNPNSCTGSGAGGAGGAATCSVSLAMAMALAHITVTPNMAVMWCGVHVDDLLG
jgi:hypothetical protein